MTDRALLPLQFTILGQFRVSLRAAERDEAETLFSDLIEDGLVLIAAGVTFELERVPRELSVVMAAKPQVET